MDSGAWFERLVSLQKEIEIAERRLAELAAERKGLDSERTLILDASYEGRLV